MFEKILAGKVIYWFLFDKSCKEPSLWQLLQKSLFFVEKSFMKKQKKITKFLESQKFVKNVPNTPHKRRHQKVAGNPSFWRFFKPKSHPKWILVLCWFNHAEFFPL